jgi:hypothetical protein
MNIYSIHFPQPVFRFGDRLRVEKSLPLLAETVEDLNAAYVRSADAHDCIDHNTANVSFLEDQLASLQRKRQSRQKEKTALDAEIASLEKTVETGILISPGLCIRTLDKALVKNVLSYLNPSGGVNKVCKYWAEMAAELRQNPVTAAPAKPTTHVLKRTKSEIKTSLAQIQSGIMLRELSRKQAAQAAAALGGSEVPGSGPNSPAREQTSGKAGSTANGTATPALSATSVSGSNAALGAATTTAAASSVGENTAAAVHGKYAVTMTKYVLPFFES